VSCPTISLCVAVDQSGNVITSTAPTGAASKWVLAAADGSNPAGFASVSCASAALCVAADDLGNLVASTNPTGGTHAWILAAVDAPAGGSNGAGSVTCPTAGLCLAVASGSAGNLLLSSTNPSGGASAWTKTTGILGGVPLEAVFCASATLCVAEDPATDVATSSNPTGGSAAWTTDIAVGTPNHLSGGAACPSASLCVVVGEDDIVTSSSP
jgi:hypothetical protein